MPALGIYLSEDYSYWAASSPDRIGEHLKKRIECALSNNLTTGIAERLRRVYHYYYGFDAAGIHATSQILRAGEAGELAEMRVNHSRSLVNTLLNLIVAAKLVWSPKAVNIDYDSIRECELAAGILEYYWTECDVGRLAVSALEDALVFCEGFILLEWDDEAGEDYAQVPGGGSPVQKTGDVNLYEVQPWDVIRDERKTSWESLDWVIVRRRMNRHNLVAKYPNKAKEIYELGDEIPTTATSIAASVRGLVSEPTESDDTACYTFFHKRSPAIPQGRQTTCLADGTVLADSVLDYSEVPLFRVSAGELKGTPFGYSPFLDILGVQELIDSLHSSVASNQTTLGTQCIAMTAGSEINFQDIAGGMRAIETPPGMPAADAVAPIQLTKTAPEIFNHLESLKKDQELLIGLNGVVRGEAQSGEMSGSALALLQSQALQQSSTIQQNYLRFVENIGAVLLATIKAKASIPRKVAILGKANSFLVTDTEYTKDSLTRVKRVQVEIGNPLSQTAAGRTEMGKDLLQMGLIKTAEQYMQVQTTGRLEPLTQGVNAELMLIRAENEQLSRGEQPPVILTDSHTLHAREHLAVLASPAARANPTIVQAVLKHLDEHERLYMTTPPPLTAMLAGMPPPMAPAGPGGPGGPPPPGGPGGPPPGPPPKGPPPESAAPPGSEPGLGAPPKMPRPPTNPATGIQHNNFDGGGMVPR